MKFEDMSKEAKEFYLHWADEVLEIAGYNEIEYDGDRSGHSSQWNYMDTPLARKAMAEYLWDKLGNMCNYCRDQGGNVYP